MGAIFGVWGSVSDDELRSMAGSLAHRGKSVHIRRLGDDLAVGAIGTDPALSVLTESGQLLVCDATVYNAADLGLPAQHTEREPSRATPAQIISTLHQAEGAEGLARIDGDYAFALIDRRRGELVLGRSFLGIRPLHYSCLPAGRLAFASEYKALLQLSQAIPQVDRDMAQHLQCAKSLPVGRTLLVDVLEVPPSATLRLDRTGAVRGHAELEPLVVDIRTTDESEAVDLVLHSLREALRRRSEDLDRVGLALSGGIDSIGLAFLLRDLYPKKPIHTFTAGYGADDPETTTATRVAAQIGSIHHEVTTGPDLVTEPSLSALTWHLEDPVARSETLQLYWIARTARDHVDVVIHGDGADAVFAGMPRHRLLWLMAKLRPLRRPLHEFYDLSQLGLPPRTLLGKALDRVYNRQSVPPVPGVLGARMPEPTTLPPLGPEFVNVNCALSLPRGKRGQKFDRTFAAWGLEARGPFYDREFCRAMFSITEQLKLRGGTNKYILRRALAKVVPPEFIDTPKFPQRMRYDMAFSSALEAVAAQALTEDAIRRRGLFAPEGVRRLFRRSSGRPYSAEAAMRLWTAVLTELWAQHFVDRRGAPMSAHDDPSSAAERPLVAAFDRTPARAP